MAGIVHIASAHFGADKHRWEAIQKDYIERNTSQPYQFHVSNSGPTHARSWDQLFWQYIILRASNEDYLVWMDGDAFPVRDGWLQEVMNLVDEYGMIAPMREKAKDIPWPHPCFTATTVGLWREIGGTWERGIYLEDDGTKKHNDYGGRVAELLYEANVTFYELQRLDAKHFHHVLFALFGDEAPLVYHHGAGYRVPVFSADGPPEVRNKFAQANAQLSDEWHTKIKTNPDFWRELL